MAILKILTKEDELLYKKSRPVEEITPRILRLLDDMKDTLHKANGAGLAAPQVGVLRRIVLVETDPGDLIELINPEIIEVNGEQKKFFTNSEEMKNILQQVSEMPDGFPFETTIKSETFGKGRTKYVFT